MDRDRDGSRKMSSRPSPASASPKGASMAKISRRRLHGSDGRRGARAPPAPPLEPSLVEGATEADGVGGGG